MKLSRSKLSHCDVYLNWVMNDQLIELYNGDGLTYTCRSRLAPSNDAAAIIIMAIN